MVTKPLSQLAEIHKAAFSETCSAIGIPKMRNLLIGLLSLVVVLLVVGKFGSEGAMQDLLLEVGAKLAVVVFACFPFIYLWNFIEQKALHKLMWSPGLKLEDAIEHFAPIEDRRQLSDLRLEFAAEFDRTPMIGSMAKIGPDTNDRLYALRKRMFQNFINELKTGRLLATGTDREKKREVAIPSSHWNVLKPNISKSSAEGSGYQYLNIRVREKSDVSR